MHGRPTLGLEAVAKQRKLRVLALTIEHSRRGMCHDGLGLWVWEKCSRVARTRLMHSPRRLKKVHYQTNLEISGAETKGWGPEDRCRLSYPGHGSIT